VTDTISTGKTSPTQESTAMQVIKKIRSMV